jgi:hypothetical protein
MRIVRNKLVLRLKQPLTAELVNGINDHFSDMINRGRFEERGALPEENDEPELLELSRLVCYFNRRSHGRLRQLIDCINSGSVQPFADWHKRV